MRHFEQNNRTGAFTYILYEKWGRKRWKGFIYERAGAIMHDHNNSIAIICAKFSFFLNMRDSSVCSKQETAIPTTWSSYSVIIRTQWSENCCLQWRGTRRHCQVKRTFSAFMFSVCNHIKCPASSLLWSTTIFLPASPFILSSPLLTTAKAFLSQLL